MHLLAIALVVSLQAPQQEPRRVSPSSGTRPEYRELKEGEHRVEGLLQRVECPAGRAVTFVVKLQEGVGKYQAPRLDAVEYIAHTPDFKGPMSCGGRGAGDPVLLTWKNVDKTQRAVAIEFVPRPEK
jgi:hypothetical protein